MGKGSSSSQANQTTSNQYADNKVANESGIVMRDGRLDLSDRSSSWDASTTSTATGSYNTTTDQGTVKAAFDFAKGNDATLGAGLSSVLTFAKDISTRNTDAATTLASRFSDGVAQAYDSARNTTPGGIDNKTMTIMAVAAAGAVAAFAMSKGR
jgi:hypothetical protein